MESTRMSIGTRLVHLNDSIAAVQLSFLKIACSVLDIPRHKVEQLNCFTEVYSLIQEKRPADSLSLVVKILSALGVSEFHLSPLKNEVQEEASIEDTPMLDLVVTVSRVLLDLAEGKYISLKEIARMTYFDHYTPCKIVSRSHLLELMLDGNHLTVEKFGFLFAWLEVIECRTHQQHLYDFCERQGIVVPEWQKLIPLAAEKFSKVKVIAKYNSDTVIIGRPTQLTITTSSSGSYPTPDQLIGNIRPGQHLPPFYSQSTQRDVSPSDNNGLSIAFPSTEHGNPQDRGEVVMGGGTSSIPTNVVTAAPNRGRGNVNSDPTTIFQMNDVVEPDAPLINPINGVDYQPNQDRIQQHIVQSSQQVIDEKNLVVKTYQPIKIPNCLILLCFLLSFMLLVLSSLTGGFTYYFIGPPHSDSTYLIGSGTLVFIDCYSTLHTRSISVSKASTQEFQTQMYLLNKNNITTVASILPIYNITLRETANLRIGINYGGTDSPIYTADAPATYMYQLSTASDTNLTDCPLRLFLFDSSDDYNDFRGEHSGPVDGAINSSQCIPVTTISNTYSVNFSLPKRGFYFVGLDISKGVSVNISVSASLMEFDIPSSIFPQRCELNNFHSTCNYHMTDDSVPSSDEDICLLVESGNHFLQNISVHSVPVIWNRNSVLTLSVGSGMICVYVILSCMLVSAVYILRKRKVNVSRHGYEPIS